jgi:serine/threonine protein kinase
MRGLLLQVFAVDYCHRRGVVNRDIKLENALLQVNSPDRSCAPHPSLPVTPRVGGKLCRCKLFWCQSMERCCFCNTAHHPLPAAWTVAMGEDSAEIKRLITLHRREVKRKRVRERQTKEHYHFMQCLKDTQGSIRDLVP